MPIVFTPQKRDTMLEIEGLPEVWRRLPKPNSWTYNFVEVSGHNLESFQTWAIRIVQCLHYKPVSNHICSRGGVKSVEVTVNSKEEKALLEFCPNYVQEFGLPEQKRYDAAECGPAQGAFAAAGRLPRPGTAGGGKRRLGARRLYPSPQYQHSKGKGTVPVSVRHLWVWSLQRKDYWISGPFVFVVTVSLPFQPFFDLFL